MDHVDLDDVRKDLLMWLEMIAAADDAYESLPASVRATIESEPPESQLAARMATLAAASPAYRAMLTRTLRAMLEIADQVSRPTLAIVAGDESPR